VARILVAEDETAVREFVVRALGHSGHAIVAVEDGQMAARALARERFDLLLTDIVMPGMDGIALALKAAKEWPAMPIVMMTGFAAERQRAHNLDALIHTVLAKPFTLADLVASVNEALAARKPRNA
jgi:DNA-binding response OmpR family regulator